MRRSAAAASPFGGSGDLRLEGGFAPVGGHGRQGRCIDSRDRRDRDERRRHVRREYAGGARRQPADRVEDLHALRDAAEYRVAGIGAAVAVVAEIHEELRLCGIRIVGARGSDRAALVLQPVARLVCDRGQRCARAQLAVEAAALHDALRHARGETPFPSRSPRRRSAGNSRRAAAPARPRARSRRGRAPCTRRPPSLGVRPAESKAVSTTSARNRWFIDPVPKCRRRSIARLGASSARRRRGPPSVRDRASGRRSSRAARKSFLAEPA